MRVCGQDMGYSFLLDPRFPRTIRFAQVRGTRGDDKLDDNAFFTVLGSMFRILPIFMYDMPSKCNSVAFWANFWYKYGCLAGRTLMWAVISAVFRIGCDRLHHFHN